MEHQAIPWENQFPEVLWETAIRRCQMVNLQKPGLLSYVQSSDAQSDRMYVDRDILLDELTERAPWFFSILYTDGGAISIPLELMFYEPIKGSSATLFRRHKQTGRIIPCQISLDDPKFKDKQNDKLSWQDVLTRVVPPRFDPALTPTIINYLNQEQMISFSIGILNVIKLQLYNPVLFGWAASAENAAAKTALSALAKRVVTQDAATLGTRLASEVAGLEGNAFQRFLEAVRRLGVVRGVSPQVKADAIQVIAKQFELEVGGQAVASGGRILIAAKDARTILQVAQDGSIMFGRCKIVGTNVRNRKSRPDPPARPLTLLSVPRHRGAVAGLFQKPTRALNRR